MGRNFGGVSASASALRICWRRSTRAGRKVSIVGWSLGGVYARDLALQTPEMVRSVITLGSPFTGDIRATNATRLYEVLSGEGRNDIPGASRRQSPATCRCRPPRSIRAPTAS